MTDETAEEMYDRTPATGLVPIMPAMMQLMAASVSVARVQQKMWWGMYPFFRHLV